MKTNTAILFALIFVAGLITRATVAIVHIENMTQVSVCAQLNDSDEAMQSCIND